MMLDVVRKIRHHHCCIGAFSGCVLCVTLWSGVKVEFDETVVDTNNLGIRKVFVSELSVWSELLFSKSLIMRVI